MKLSISKDNTVKWIGVIGGIIGVIGGITAIVISIGGVVSGYGSQSTQVGLLSERVGSLETKRDTAALEAGDLKRQMSVLDTKMSGTTTTFEDSFKKIEIKLNTAVSSIVYLEKEISLLDSRITQNTSDLAEAYKKFTAVSPKLQKCLVFAEELETGNRLTSMGWVAIERKDVMNAMKELNCNAASQ